MPSAPPGRVLILFGIALIVAGSLSLSSPGLIASEGPRVRIGILLNQESAAIHSEGPIEVGDPAVQSVVTIPAGTYDFRPAADGIDGAGRRFGPVIRLHPAAGRLQVGTRRYRGVIELRRAAARITVVNELDVEEYLYGVLKMEVDPRWPPDALRAQAVAARTLALHSLGRFAAEGYDLRATTDSQVYAGINAEDPRATAAVDASRGIVLTHAGRPIFAAYHADSGGVTESSEFVWGGAYPYLRGVPDPYGADSPVREWLSRLDGTALEARLSAAGRPVSGLASVAVAATTPSGRAASVRLTGAHSAVDLRATELRSLLGVSFLRSTFFTVRVVSTDESPAVEFAGRGSGHGVGMSQWGARGQALLGRTYREILRYYYQGVQLETR